MRIDDVVGSLSNFILGFVLYARIVNWTFYYSNIVCTYTGIIRVEHAELCIRMVGVKVLYKILFG